MNKKSITLFVLSITISIILIPVMDSFGYTFVGVTTNGVEFPILSASIIPSENNTATGTGAGDSIFDGLGVYMVIQNIGTNGQVYFGSGISGSQTDIRQYVEVGSNDDWAIAVTDNDYSEILFVPELGKEYRYVSGTLVNASNISNILGYSSSIILSGSPNISIGSNGVTVSGTGKILAKINNMANVTTILRTDIPSGASIKIVKSPYDLFSVPHDSRGFEVCSENEGTGFFESGLRKQQHKSSKGTPSHAHTYQYYIQALFNFSLNCEVGKASTQLVQFDYAKSYRTNTVGYGHTTSSAIVSLPSGLIYPSLLSSSGTTNLGFTLDNSGVDYSRVITGSGSHGSYSGIVKIYDIVHTVSVRDYTANIEQVFTFPLEQLYLLVEPNGHTVKISAQAFDPAADVFLQVNDLPADIAFDVSKSGLVGIVGKTSSIGKISLLYRDVDFGVYASPGGILKIYPNSTKYLGNFGIGMIDLLHDASIELSASNDLVYIPQNYVRLVFLVSVDVKNVSVDNVQLNYLNKNYTKNEALMVPVIPSATTLYATINETDVEILMRDVATTTQIKQVPQKTSTSSDHTTDGTAATTSNISTSTFLTATHTGTMNVNLDFKVAGSVDFTMDSTYTGEFTKSPNCNWHGASSPSRTFSCRNYYTPSSPSSITNMVSLTVDQQTQLTVEVDILRNMGAADDSQTILVYTSNSAEAYITSTFSEARYGASNQVSITYPMTSISENIAIPVTSGDMMEFVVRVNLDVSGAPTPSSADARYSSYVKATTELGGGIISVGMS